MIFLPDDSPLNVDKDKVPANTTSYQCATCGNLYDVSYAHVCPTPDMSVMQALEVIRQSAGDITFSNNSLIENIKGDVRVACNKEWVEWVEKIFWFDHDGQTMGFNISANKLYKLYNERRKEIGI
jgi:DNA-directed RNA polymerase subunit RPC12/RpoP